MITVTYSIIANVSKGGINMSRTPTELTITLKVDTTELDEALKKAERLNQLLNNTKSKDDEVIEAFKSKVAEIINGITIQE